MLVLALTGSALAVTQERIYNGDEAEASGVTGVQQHSVFVEIIVEDKDGEEEVHKFAAVVGLIKKCKRVRNVFDNAVLWFNDQFLFGEKNNEQVRNETPESALGVNPEDNNLKKPNGETGRWGGCYTPDGFAFAIGKDDPYGAGPVFASDEMANATGREGCEQARASAADNGYEGNATAGNCGPLDDNMDLVKRLIDLDQACAGCIFEYQSSFFISDPNMPDTFEDVSWIVDKMVYPVSVLGNLFQEGEDNIGNDGSCESDDGTVPVSDPRDSYPHHDRCDDRSEQGNHDCSDGEACHNETQDAVLVEPLFAVHLQVDSSGMGYVDQAPWTYEDGSDVKGMPITENPFDEAYEGCKTDQRASYECSIEYNFLLAVDFAAFDNGPTDSEDEIRETDVRHGKGENPQPDAAAGNSHAHNPRTFDAGPQHAHDALTLDVFFYEEAPYFVTENAYWDENGAPPAVNEDCSGPEQDVSDERREAIEVRTPIVCDTDEDGGEFHAHDGSETVDYRDVDD